MSDPTPFFLDSQSAEDLAVNPVYHKHIFFCVFLLFYAIFADPVTNINSVQLI